MSSDMDAILIGLGVSHRRRSNLFATG